MHSSSFMRLFLMTLIFLSSHCGPILKSGTQTNISTKIYSLKDFLGNPSYPDNFWTNSTPETEGLDPEYLIKALEYIDRQKYEIHSFLVIRHGKLVFERYGRDKSVDNKQLTPNDLHEMHSTTKTFTSALIGIAIHEGLIPNVNVKVMDYFQNSRIKNLTGDKERMTIENLLTMQSGLEYSEGNDDYLYSISINSAEAILGKPMAGGPDSTWNYSSGNSQILSEILRRASGKTPLQYGLDKLFTPLGISDFRWMSDQSGTQYGGWGLFIKPRDLARFGYLYLNKGVWKGRAIVPASWVEVSTTNHSLTPWPSGKYGYHCWIPNIGGFATRGYMGQHMYIFPDKDLIIVFTSALPYQSADIDLDVIVRDFVLKSLIQTN